MTDDAKVPGDELPEAPTEPAVPLEPEPGEYETELDKPNHIPGEYVEDDGTTDEGVEP